jgi:hypothetical protein
LTSLQRVDVRPCNECWCITYVWLDEIKILSSFFPAHVITTQKRRD